jgi:hypothetical protein
LYTISVTITESGGAYAGGTVVDAGACVVVVVVVDAARCTGD